MRAHRERTGGYATLSAEQRARHIARTYANVYQRRGRLVPQPCEVCGATEGIEKHHDDYARPLDVRWFCRPHHLEVEACKRDSMRVARVNSQASPEVVAE